MNAALHKERHGQQMTITLRPYQTAALDRLRQGIREANLIQMLMLATGGGKTAIASAMMQGANAKGKRCYFIVDTLELVEQAYERFVADGLEVGIIQSNSEFTDITKPIQVGTIQTLRGRWERIHPKYKPDLVVIDEAHVIHKKHKDIIDQCRHLKVPVIGLSATPFRKGLGKIFDNMVVGATVKELTDHGFLVPARIYAPYTPDMAGVKTKSNGDFDGDAAAEKMSDQAIIGDIVEHWIKHAEHRRTLVFAANVKHSRAICDEFTKAGINAVHLDGYMEKEERKQIIEAFRKGQITVLCNVQVLTKGFDVPSVSCMVDAAPTKSLMQHYQKLGRVLRIAEGKEDAIILDHSGNCIRNGLPTDSLPEDLDVSNKSDADRKIREKKERLPEPCTACTYLKVTHKCPACGFAPVMKEMPDIEVGELREITGSKKKATMQEKQRWFSMLNFYAIERGYMKGWASHKYRERFGCWPKNIDKNGQLAMSEDVRIFLKHLKIKHAMKNKGGRR